MSAPIVIPFNYDPVGKIYRSSTNGGGAASYSIPSGEYGIVKVYTAGALFTIAGNSLQGFKGGRYFTEVQDLGASTVAFACPTNRAAIVTLNKTTNMQLRIKSGNSSPYSENLSVITSHVPLVTQHSFFLQSGDDIYAPSGVTDLIISVRYVDGLADPLHGEYIATAGESVSIDAGSYGGFGYFQVMRYKKVS